MPGTETTPIEKAGLYRLVESLGRGGMGTVHRAVHSVTGAEVAIKTVRPTEPGLMATLRREIHALAQVRHPGIVRILEDGVEDGIPWYAMELVEGATLRHYLKLEGGEAVTAHDSEPEGFTTQVDTGPDASGMWSEDRAELSGEWGQSASGLQAPPPDMRWARRHEWDIVKGLAVIRRLCDVLAFLHGEGIVHRDLKPENVIVRQDGSPVLVDFGLVTRFTAQGGRETLDVPSTATGTAAYIAPEQAGGELVDARADLYSLGCILYELVVGRPPFVGDNAAVMRYQHTSLQPVPPSAVDPRVDDWPGLEDLILQLLSKNPRKRLGHATDVAAALERIGAPSPPDDRAPAARSYLYRPAFVGRAHELKGLVEQLDRLGEGVGSSAFLTGESGVGKTRLLLEMCRDARRRGFRVFACRCPAPPGPDAADFSVRARPLEPMRPLLQMVADQCQRGDDPELQAVVTEQARLLALYEPALISVTGPLMFAREMTPEQARHRLFASVEQTLAMVTRKRPAVLAMDDLQWADELTLGFVQYLVGTQHGRRMRVALVGTWRREEATGRLERLGETSGVHLLQLERLSEREVRSMVGDMLALREPPQSLVDYLTENSEGNPFFVGEYLHAALDEQILRRNRAGRWEVPELTDPRAKTLAALSLPRGMRELIGRRLEDLGPRARRLLIAAAVAGRTVELSLLERLVGLKGAEFMNAVKELVRRQFMEQWDAHRLAFVHSKIREVAYGRIPAETREGLHRAIAEELERTSQDREDLQATLAHHYEAAGEAEQAMGYYLAAARQTADRYAGREAEQLYRSALRLLPDDRREAATTRLELVERVLLPAGATEEAVTEAERGLEQARGAGSQHDVAMGLRLLAEAHHASGRYESAMDCAGQARDLFAELGDRAGAAAMLEQLSLSASRIGRR